MIASLRSWLQANITRVPKWFQAGTVAPTEKPPFGIIEIGADFRVVDNLAGVRREVRLTVHLPQGSWVAVDDAAEEVRTKLHGQQLTRASGGERYSVEWAQTTGGFVVPEYKAFARTVIFSVPLKA